MGCIREYLAARSTPRMDLFGEPIFVSLTKGGKEKTRISRIGLSKWMDTLLLSAEITKSGRAAMHCGIRAVHYSIRQPVMSKSFKKRSDIRQSLWRQNIVTEKNEEKHGTRSRSRSSRDTARPATRTIRWVTCQVIDTKSRGCHGRVQIRNVHRTLWQRYLLHQPPVRMLQHVCVLLCSARPHNQ